MMLNVIWDDVGLFIEICEELKFFIVEFIVYFE